MKTNNKTKVKIAMQALFILIALYLSFIIISLMTAIIGTTINTPKYIESQKTHISQLKAQYAANAIAPVDEDKFTTFSNTTLSNEVKINELRYLATHNSYKKELSPTSFFCFNYAIPFAGASNGATAYNYGFESLTEQLNNGIRSFELDISRRLNGELQCMHNTLLDSNSNAIDFETAFEELKLWSDNNPKHLPIMILIEAKAGLWIFDTKDATADDIANLGKTAKGVFGDKLYTPNDMLKDGSALDFKDMTENNKYPSVNSMRGKILFMLHPGKATSSYIDLDKTMKTQQFFAVIDGKDVLVNKDLIKYSCFALSNDPQSDSVSVLANDLNMIVRTRLNIYPKHSEADYIAGMRSNANILSSDYPPRTVPNGESYVSYLDQAGKKTITLRKHM